MDRTIFFEALACVGGCANGPCKVLEKPGVLTMSDIMRNIKFRPQIPSEPAVVVEKDYPKNPVEKKAHTAEEFFEAIACGSTFGRRCGAVDVYFLYEKARNPKSQRNAALYAVGNCYGGRKLEYY